MKLGAAVVDGEIIVVGGATDTGGRTKLATTELVDLAAGTVRPGPSLSQGQYLGGATSFRTVTAVGEHTVLVAGGYDDRIVPTDSAVLVTLPGR